MEDSSDDAVPMMQGYPPRRSAKLLPHEVQRDIREFRNIYQTEGQLFFCVPKFRRFASPPYGQRGSERSSPPLYVRGLEWRCHLVHGGSHLVLSVQCCGPIDVEPSSREWNGSASARVAIKEYRRQGGGWKLEEADGVEKAFPKHTFHSGASGNGTEWGYREVVSFAKLLDDTNDYLLDAGSDGKLRVEFSVKAGRVFYGERATLTFKLDNFAHFVEHNECRVSLDTASLSGYPFRIKAMVKDSSREGDDANSNTILEDKVLGFFLSCNEDEKGKPMRGVVLPDWKCSVSANLSVLPACERRDSGDELWGEYAHLFDGARRDPWDWGYSYFAKCKKLLDRSLGFLNSPGTNDDVPDESVRNGDQEGSDRSGYVTLRAEIFPTDEMKPANNDGGNDDDGDRKEWSCIVRPGENGPFRRRQFMVE